MSYTEISPDAYPIPTTSIAGDCTRHVIAGLGAEVIEPLRRLEAGYLWIQVLESLSELGYWGKRQYELCANIPELH